MYSNRIILKFTNYETCNIQQRKQPANRTTQRRKTLRFNRENGMIYISKAFASELGIKDIDKVQFANDEENTKDWFICKTDSEQGFSIKYDKGGIRFMNKFLSNKILDCAKVKDNASFLMEKESLLQLMVLSILR